MNLVSFTYGVYSAWPAVVQGALTADPSPVGVALDRHAFAWIASLGMPGALLGTLFWGVLADRCGRKATGYLTMVPFLVSWAVLLAGARTEGALMAARFLGGVGASGAAVNCPMYVGELSDDRTRDVLGSLFMLAYNLGVLYVFVVGTFADYAWLNAAGLAASAVFVVAWRYAPESPMFLLRQRRTGEAIDALKWFRCAADSQDVQPEINRMLARIAGGPDAPCAEYLARGTVKALLVGLVFQTGTQLSGINVILAYAVDIFKRSGSHLSPAACTVLVGGVQVFASVFASCVVKRAGRKCFLIGTYLMTAAALFIMSWCLYASAPDGVAPAGTTGALPVFSLSLHVVAFSLGLGMVPYILYTEIFPPGVYNVCMSVLMFWNHALGFGVVKACGDNMHHQTFWALGAACLAIVPFAYLCVPETKDKSYEDVQRELLLWFPGIVRRQSRAPPPTPQPGIVEDGLKAPLPPPTLPSSALVDNTGQIIELVAARYREP